jgi:hypothetical protein
MTILGQHTVAETRDFLRSTNYRVNAIVNQWEAVRKRRVPPNTPEQTALDTKVVAFVRRWTNVRDQQTALLAASMLSNPMVSPSVLPAEVNFVAVTNAVQRTDPRLIEVQGEVNAEAVSLALPALDLSKNPPQDSPDLDFGTLKVLDNAIAHGEAAAKAAGTGVVNAAKSNTGLIVLGTLAVVGGGIVAVKVYL